MRVRLIGAGNIGSALAEEADRLGLEVEVADVDEKRARNLAAEVDGTVVDSSGPVDEVDLVVEAATQDVVRGPVLDALEAGVDALVMTTGAFTDPDLLDRAREAVDATGASCRVPSGGLAGLDAVKALAVQEGATVTLTTRKPPSSLGPVDAGTEGEVFRGTAKEAVQAFPKNVNVAASLVLAGLTPEVRIVADPDRDRNSHKVHVRSPTVEVRTNVASQPSPDNPATSHIAVLSARATLRDLAGGLDVGT
jgi:aspartate dehydrogenase